MPQFDPSLVALGLLQSAIASRGFRGRPLADLVRFAYDTAEAFADEGVARGYLMKHDQPTEAPTSVPAEPEGTSLTVTTMTVEELDQFLAERNPKPVDPSAPESGKPN